MPPKTKTDDQVFTFHEVACLMAAMTAKGVILGTKHFDLMASLDGNRSSSGFEHKFRAVKARGKELASELGGEGPGTPATSAKKGTPGSKKRGKAADAFNGADDDEEATPSKKTKTGKGKKAEEVKKEPSEELEDGANGLETSYFEDAIGSTE